MLFSQTDVSFLTLHDTEPSQFLSVFCFWLNALSGLAFYPITRWQHPKDAARRLIRVNRHTSHLKRPELVKCLIVIFLCSTVPRLVDNL